MTKCHKVVKKKNKEKLLGKFKDAQLDIEKKNINDSSEFFKPFSGSFHHPPNPLKNPHSHHKLVEDQYRQHDPCR